MVQAGFKYLCFSPFPSSRERPWAFLRVWLVCIPSVAIYALGCLCLAFGIGFAGQCLHLNIYRAR